MRTEELYKLLDDAGVDFEVVDVFEGLRVINVVVDEQPEPTDYDNEPLVNKHHTT